MVDVADPRESRGGRFTGQILIGSEGRAGGVGHVLVSLLAGPACRGLRQATH